MNIITLFHPIYNKPSENHWIKVIAKYLKEENIFDAKVGFKLQIREKSIQSRPTFLGVNQTFTQRTYNPVLGTILPMYYFAWVVMFTSPTLHDYACFLNSRILMDVKKSCVLFSNSRTMRKAKKHQANFYLFYVGT
jgi:hypothetical protein